MRVQSSAVCPSSAGSSSAVSSSAAGQYRKIPENRVPTDVYVLRHTTGELFWFIGLLNAMMEKKKHIPECLQSVLVFTNVDFFAKP